MIIFPVHDTISYSFRTFLIMYLLILRLKFVKIFYFIVILIFGGNFCVIQRFLTDVSCFCCDKILLCILCVCFFELSILLPKR